MTDLATMQARILREVQRDGITAEVTDAIVTAIAGYRGQHFEFNLATANAALSASVAVLAIPTGFVDLVRLELSASASGSTAYRVEHDRSFDELRAERNAQGATAVGQPAHLAIFADQLHFDTPASDTYQATIWYLKDLPEVSASATAGATNAWMTKGERLIRTKAKELLYEDRLYNFRRALAYRELAEDARRQLVGEVPSRGRLTPTEF